MSEDEAIENKSWLYATIITLFLAVIMFFVQHFVIQLFDVGVEVAVFYLPAALIIAVYLWRHFKSRH